MSTLGKAVIEFSADTARFQGDVGRAAASFDKHMGGMIAAAKRFAGPAAIGLVALKLADLTKSAIDAGDQLLKLSQKSGLTVERLGELKHGAALADVDMQQLTVGLKEFNRSLTEAVDPASKAGMIFRALGVDISKGPDAALRQFADAIAAIKDPAQKSTVAIEVMGKAGADMIPWLNQGAAGMEKAAEQARKLGLIMSTETAIASEQLNDNLKILKSNTDALGISLANKLVPGLATMSGKLVEANEKGNLFGQTLLEVLKIAAAIGGTLGIADPKALQGLFNAEERAGAMRGGADVWKMVGSVRQRFGLDAAPAGEMGPPKPNSEMLACALSGGKWVNGKCVRGNDSSAKKLADLDKRMREAAAAEAQASYSAFLDDGTAAHKEAQEARLKALQDAAAEERKLRQATAQFEIDLANENLEALTENADRFAGAIDNAFDRAVRGGGKFVDILKNLGQELINIEIQKRLFAPASKALGAGLDKFFAGLFGGGGSTLAGAAVAGEPSYAEGTDYVPRTGWAMLHQGERVIPAAQNVGGGAVPIVFSPQVYIDSRSDRAQVAADVDQAMRASEARILDSYYRNGRFARAARSS